MEALIEFLPMAAICKYSCVAIVGFVYVLVSA